MQIKFLNETQNTDVAIVVGVFENLELSSAAQILDETTHGLIKTALKNNRFKGKIGESLNLIAPNDLKVRRILLAGMGKKEELDEAKLQNIGGHIYAALESTPDPEAVLHLGDLTIKSYDSADIAAHMAYGMQLRSWHFDKYFTKQKQEEKPQLTVLTVITAQPDEAEKKFKPLNAVAEGVLLCRELATEPGNILHPESYPELIKDTLKPLGVEVEILGEKEMGKLGMGSLLAVGQGSEKESHLVVMQWKGGPKDQQPVGFVGKGVTFDTGGISIKPRLNMEDMKYDMAGSAAVVGLMKTLAMRKAKVNAVGVVGIVENMPSGKALRPGDVITSMSGQTIEVLDTDAEGRLVLADALWYTQDRFKPQFMINLATLTGAIAIALGSLHAGLFSNNDELSRRLQASGTKTGDEVWRMPMGEGYNKMLKSVIADMRNISLGREAGSITAAQFLERYVNNVPWAHLDIAGTAWNDKGLPTAAKGATGFGVKLLNDLVKEYYEA